MKKLFSILICMSLMFTCVCLAIDKKVEASNISNTLIHEEPLSLDVMKQFETLSSFYIKKADGNIALDMSNPELYKIGFTNKQLQELNQLTQEFKIIKKENIGVETRGFVGLQIKLGKKTRAKGAIAGGAFVTGYVGWHIRKIAIAGPWGAGAAAVITATCASSVAYAISKGWKKVNVGVNIPFVKFSYTIQTP
ncbi:MULTISPECIES: hypothetical protein [Brochothrix]|uniref:Secreted protein n=1 Tax=Brochothrix thermosphacta TaxID=2756 RepID=A0A1D2KFM6_BROTH|nr:MULTISPECIES: hypothetical protein [Brochothrix]ATF25858.1 hypothetical protein CNY62_05295 [Brochothrix thermosphacta]ATH85194.1 hypothetical protein CPF12_04865 [Brochothrix thermosphacta]MBR5526346.1 hypothetical protein [Brochothrix sp.]MPQ28569.1 hypothetical protein [Brochothrix thermosphacta]ODJ56526.1 hypothetical protein BFR38_00990 [Brochothrix thermosphacta]